MKRVGVILLVLVVALAAFVAFPRAGTASAADAATLAVLHGDVDAQHAGGSFTPALDGDLLTAGDVVRATDAGHAVITFFEGSTLTVEPGSQVTVQSLARVAGDGLQVTILQTLGHTWASVQKLQSPNAKFEVRTPNATAAVRGTAFETIVEVIEGRTVTTVLTSEGEVVVRADAGGETSVRAGQQIQVPQGAPVPREPAPRPILPRLRFGVGAGAGFTVIDPRGFQCGSVARQIPGCTVAGTTVTIAGPVSGTYNVALTAATSAPGTTLTLEGSRTDAVDVTARFTTDLTTGDLVRTSVRVTVPSGGAITTGGFTPAERVTSVCGAEATGRVFSSGGVNERSGALAAYGKASPKQPAALVLTAAELTGVAAESVAGAKVPVAVTNVTVTVDNAGLHLGARAAAGPISVPASGDIVAGASGGRLVMRLRGLDLGPLPGVVRDQIATAIEGGLNSYAAGFPLAVERVALRQGCLAIIGATP